MGMPNLQQATCAASVKLDCRRAYSMFALRAVPRILRTALKVTHQSSSLLRAIDWPTLTTGKEVQQCLELCTRLSTFDSTTD